MLVKFNLVVIQVSPERHLHMYIIDWVSKAKCDKANV